MWSLPFLALSMAVVSLGMGFKNHTSEDQELLQVIGKWSIFSGILSFILFYSIGISPVPWVYNSEIYPLHLRGVGNGMATTMNWVCNFIL